MKVRWIAAIVVALVLCRPTGGEWDALGERLLRFNDGWQVFIRGYFGCPQTGTVEWKDCRPALGTVDYRVWRSLTEQAKELWGLEEKQR